MIATAKITTFAHSQLVKSQVPAGHLLNFHVRNQAGEMIQLGVSGLANNLYVQIGLVLLIALASKNAILIVESARDLRLKQGYEIADAAVEAAKRRFRPILMTSFAFILGVVPLVTATGAGAAARQSLGISVFSGMLASTCIAILFVPCLFALLQRIDERAGHKSSSIRSAAACEGNRE